MSSYRDDFRESEREFYWSAPRVLLAALVAASGLCVLAFFANGADFLSYKFWAPKQENVRREVFENTNSYVQGKIGNLMRLRLDYETGDEGHRAALRTMILTEASGIDNSKLPADLRGFVTTLKGAY